MILDHITKENDVKALTDAQLDQLCEEIRAFLIEKVSVNGGHLAPNLGVVELTIALHQYLTFPDDKLIWDVGHQSYVHKLLTGRKEGFDSLRTFGGMSGFPKRKESECDAFDTGHSSTSLAAGLGFVHARRMRGEDHKIVAVIGDGAMTGGMAYEALNNAACLRTNFTIVLNDNSMSIAENVGGMSAYLDGLRTAAAYTDLKRGVERAVRKLPGNTEELIRRIKKTKSTIKQLLIPGMFFEEIGLTYLGPIDGHDRKQLYKALQEAGRLDHGVIIHVITKKGKGFEPAEKNPAKFHGIGAFDPETGDVMEVKKRDTYTDIFGKVLLDMAGRDPRIAAITAAMPGGTGLTAFAEAFPERFFDVGIAEQYATTFAAGLAAGGMRPVFAVYSSFLQRAYDQLVHDVCLTALPVVFAVDRAGIVGNDGETHQGLFDMSFLGAIPNMTILSPMNRWEMADMLRFCVSLGSPAAIRYPRGEAYEGLREFRSPIEYGKSFCLYEEEDIALMFVGHMAETAVKVRNILKERGFPCSLVNARFVKPVDEEMIIRLSHRHRLIVTMEEGVIRGGFGQQVVDFVQSRQLPSAVYKVGVDDEYVEHGQTGLIREELGLDADSVAKAVIAFYMALPYRPEHTGKNGNKNAAGRNRRKKKRLGRAEE